MEIIFDFIDTGETIITTANKEDVNDIESLYQDLKSNGHSILNENIENNVFFTLVIRNKFSNEFIGVIKYYLPQKDICWIQLLAITHKYQKLSYGSHVVNHFERYLEKERGINRFFISIQNNNMIAKNFWEKLFYYYYKSTVITRNGQECDCLIFCKKSNDALIKRKEVVLCKKRL